MAALSHIVGGLRAMNWKKRLGLLAVTALGAFQVSAHAETYPQSQGWSQSQMRIWYELSQGSRLIPEKWLSALKNEDGSPFFTRTALEALGYTYLSDAPSSMPVGFVIDRENTNSWLGFNCSACHTSKLKSGDAEVVVHGGQTMADFQTFTTGLIDAVQRAIETEEAFNIFVIQVLGEAATTEQKSEFRKEVTSWIAHRKLINDTGNESHWGRGRADAVGIILATTAAVIAKPDAAPEDVEPLPASNAPVSYPFVWNTNQQARLQHNGVVDNGADLGVLKVAKIGALIRNWTEALGVFADVKLDATHKKVVSSIRLDNLLRIEQALAELHSPRWPEAFGKLDEAKMQRGEILYKQNCGSCHGMLDANDITSKLPLIESPSEQGPNDPKGFVYLQPLFSKKTRAKDFDKNLNPSPDFIGTDPTMACNALLHKVASGYLEGEKNVVGFVPSPNNDRFADRAVTTDLLRILIQRDVLANKTKSLSAIAENQIVAAGERLARFTYVVGSYALSGQNAGDVFEPLRDQLKTCAEHLADARALAPETPLPVYKSRPMNGIWATAPYIHNGSVPTLYDLLLPQKERPASFGYFDGEMDVVKGGLKNASDNPSAFIFNTFDKDGRAIVGNWNGGHEYGTGLGHEERLDLVEYLKSL